MSLLQRIGAADLPAGEVGKPGPERLASGDPTFTIWPLDSARDGEVNTGIWRMTPGEPRSIKGELFGFCHILEGLVELTEEGGGARTFRAGDSFVMKSGFRGIWKTIETVRKIHVTVG